jgi:hypothetical protein
MPLLAGWSLATGEETKAKPSAKEVQAYLDYQQVVAKTAGMVGDAKVQQLANKHGLQVLNLTWEDTARFQNSAVGPNISDLTIQVQQKDPRNNTYSLSCMPVIRFPNFTDKTADIDANKFYVLVGNEKGQKLKKINLMHYLGNIRNYMTKHESWNGDRTGMHSNRDTHVLVSAQACFLPIPKEGEAQFNPVLFNYQSVKEDPAVLTILATHEGTSTTVIDNVRDRFETPGVWGQRLFFNQNGERASFVGKRLSDYIKGGNKEDPTKPKVEAAGQGGLNMVLLIQVPLKQKNPMRSGIGGGFGDPSAKSESKTLEKKDDRSNVENAVIGHGKVEGKFTEMDNLDIERDHKYPVRVTVQFYKATSNGMVSEKDIQEIAEQIAKVYKQGEYVGSLVVDGYTGRPTEYDGPKIQPPDWWDNFWKRHFDNTGLTREEAIKQLRKLNGPNYRPRTEQELADSAVKLPPAKRNPQPAPKTPAVPMQSSVEPMAGLPSFAGIAMVPLAAGVVLFRRRAKR